MDKFTQFLVIMTAGCLLLAACGEKNLVVTQDMNGKSISPTVESTEQEVLVTTQDMNGMSVSPTVVSTEEKVLVATQDVIGKSASPTVARTQEKVLIVTQDMKGNSVSLKVGDTFEIQIPTIPTPGFEWTAKDLDTTILLQEGKPAFKADSSPAGAGGIVTLKFKAVGTGKTNLILLYLRPSENGVPSLYSDSFGVTIEVK